ncbi:MAG: PilZ domain-containing protein [Thermoanaerobaculia bacterium]
MVEEPVLLLANRSSGKLLFDRMLLYREGRTLRLATRGTEAWRLAREILPHLIVIGYDLDDLTAPEFCRLVRGHEATRRSSILLLCDAEEGEAGEMCRAAGCNDVAFRPVHPAHFEEKVARLLSVPPRASVETLTRVEMLDAGTTVTGRTVNISSSGMLLQLDRVLPPEASLMVQFYLESGAVPIRTRSEVVRAEFTGGSPRYGLRFVDIEPVQRMRIDSFVRGARQGEM